MPKTGTTRSAVEVLEYLAQNAELLASKRRPHTTANPDGADTTREGARGAAQLRAAAELWLALARDITVNALWLRDRHQIEDYLAIAHTCAVAGGYHTGDPEVIIEVIERKPGRVV